MKRENGFTLMELMTALAISGILMSMAVPGLQSFSQNSKQTGAINDFVSSMHLARNTAITSNARVTICASAHGKTCEGVGWDQGWIIFKDANSNQNVDVGEAIVGSTGKLDRVTLQSPQYGNFIMYRPNGRAMNGAISSNTGQFTVCDKRGADHAKVVVVELSGRPRLSDYQIGGLPPVCNLIG